MSLLRKLICATVGVLITSVLAFGFLLHFPLFLMLDAIGLLLLLGVNAWWWADLPKNPADEPTRSSSLFYIINYPGDLWAFFRYMRRNKHKSNNTDPMGDKSDFPPIK